MRNLRIADPDAESRNHSPLSHCLLRLNQQPVSKPEPVTADEPTSWQEKWNANREQISSRLALIESELDRLASTGPEPPLLSVFDSELETV